MHRILNRKDNKNKSKSDDSYNIDYRICSIIYMTTPTPTNHFSIVN